MKKIIATLVLITAALCMGCGKSDQTTANPPEHVKGNIARVFMHDPSSYNSGSVDYRFIPGYFSVLEKNESKKLLWQIFCDTNATVIVDVEKGGQCWFEADVRTDDKRRGAYTNVVIHIWSEKLIERTGSGSAKFGVSDD